MIRGFVTKADSRYFPGLKNLIGSLQKTNPDIPITVFNCGLTDEQKSQVSRKVDRVLDLKVNNYKIKDVDYGRFTESIYAAMYLDKTDYDVIFHLDADIVVLENLENIFETCLSVEFLGASDYPPLNLADQISDNVVISLLSSSYPAINWNLKTFNGGVFCTTRKFFENSLLPKIREFSYLHQKFKTNDQALLNLAYASLCSGNFHDLGILYNFRPQFSRAPEIQYSEVVEKKNGLLTCKYNGETIKIYHYIREPKPWMDRFDKSSLPYKIWQQFS